MTQCSNRADGNAYMIVRDAERFIVVKETGQENEVMVTIHRKLKNTQFK